MPRPQYMMIMLNKAVNGFSHYFYFVPLAACYLLLYNTESEANGRGCRKLQLCNWRCVVNVYVNCVGQTYITVFIVVQVD
jgi:hypothetical protein